MHGCMQYCLPRNHLLAAFAKGKERPLSSSEPIAYPLPQPPGQASSGLRQAHFLLAGFCLQLCVLYECKKKDSTNGIFVQSKTHSDSPAQGEK